jgi:hypothetical protein
VNPATELCSPECPARREQDSVLIALSMGVRTNAFDSQKKGGRPGSTRIWTNISPYFSKSRRPSGVERS